MDSAITKIWDGTKKGLKWIAIQFLAIIAIGLLYYLGLFSYSLFSDMGFREIMMAYPLFGKAGAYDWWAGLCLSIPIYSLLFGWWHAFFPKKEQWWTYLFPWSLLLVFFYLHVAQERDWSFQIISVDGYMLAGWLAPMMGIILHLVLLRSAKRKKQTSWFSI